ncbi:MAG: hypothetical protein HY687_05640 [Chloroflexi bacterium]|nr:hypothetical protein [Chloroflexota bacterium]
MATALKCAHCHEEIEGKPVRKLGKVFCCEACAFEASKQTSSFCGTGDPIARATQAGPMGLKQS